MRTILNVIWFVLCGLWMAIGYALFGLLCCVTIIGIPLGLANFKLIPVLFTPLGVDIVPSDALYPTVTYRQ